MKKANLRAAARKFFSKTGENRPFFEKWNVTQKQQKRRKTDENAPKFRTEKEQLVDIEKNPRARALLRSQEENDFKSFRQKLHIADCVF